MNTKPTNETEMSDSELLASFERDFPSDYKKYYKTKRQNFFTAIQSFPKLWALYLQLDRIWLREFEDYQTVHERNVMFPLTLYMIAHAKMRVAVELAFNACMPEARSILRDSIEHVAHGHYMLTNPELQRIWLCKDDDTYAKNLFDEAFGKRKKVKLFKGLDKLHIIYSDLCETGSHPTINSVVDRVEIVNSKDSVNYRVNYSGMEEQAWAKSIFSILLTCFTMETTLYQDYASRLHLDSVLQRMRSDFERVKELTRQKLIDRYNLLRPDPP